MAIKIYDEDNLLEKGDFNNYFYNEMDLIFKNEEEQLVINTTVYKTFLLTLTENIYSLRYANKKFSISSFGNPAEYRFISQNNTIVIKKFDKLLNEETDKITFFKEDFLNAFIQSLKQHLLDLKKKNSNILNNEDYKMLTEKYEALLLFIR